MKKIFENFWFKVLMTVIVKVIGGLMFISAAYIGLNNSIESTFLFALTVFALCFVGLSCIEKNYYKLNDNEIAKLSIAYALDYLQVKHGCEKQGPWTFNEENEMLVTIRNYIDNFKINEDETEKHSKALLYYYYYS